MQFVNEIAEIVHSTVDQMNGVSNKNLGEAFLFVWRIPDIYIEKDESGILKIIKCK